MKKLIRSVRKVEFEARIFISFSIVILICVLSFVVYRSSPSNIIIAGRWFGIEPDLAYRTGYLMVAVMLMVASLLRMWAGSILTSQRVMAFKVQKSQLTTSGPYSLVRNPIYLADFIAYIAFAMCLKPAGLLLPVLIYIHYTQLVIYEEQSLQQQFGERFLAFKRITPRFIPGFSSIRRFVSQFRSFDINMDGFRHNALYLLFIPGFIVTAYTGSLIYAVIIGLPAVIDWAVIHTFIGLSPSSSEVEQKEIPAGKAELSKAKVFEDILYAQCWEDPEIDRKAFKINSEDVIFSITSGGCNVLAFLADNPRKIISLDLNPFQNYLLDLKIAAFSTLHYDEVLEFFGVIPSERRFKLYTRIRLSLKDESREFWDKNKDKISNGIIHCGRYEKYMHLLRRWFNMLAGKSLIRKLYNAKDLAERKTLYERKWNNLRWRVFTRFFLSRSFMTLLFDSAFFDHLEESFSFGSHFRNVIKRAITELPVRESSFLSYIMFGNFHSLEHLPVYLRRDNFEKIKSRLDRIEIVTGSCKDYFASLPADCISKFNFTNIFEWMPAEAFEELLRDTIRVARDKSVITYRNLLVPRSRPERLGKWIIKNKELSEKLHNEDLSFIYRAYIVEQINK
jgi:S-adenosylmethionine-diacylglycerol 3-amino-3-carboxypropyl transferase